MTLATNDSADAVESYRHGSGVGRIGLVIAGTYRITRQIGSGGSSDVFEAEHLRLGTLFAVKVLRDVERARRAAQRFRREARVVARLRSEHIVRVLDCGELEDSTPYLVMELLEGEDLRKLLNRETAIPARRAVQLVREACHALSEVHQAGLVHRDLKPENLFICRRSTGEDWCKVLDFGVAKMEASLATAQGAIVGTVRYMAPEQLADGASVGPATDVYALGAILYECLSGHSLHAGETIQEVMFSVMNRTPVALGTLCPSLPKTLVDAVERCVTKRPIDRPQQASELARLLSSALVDERSSAGSDTTSSEEEAPAARAASAPLSHPRRAPGAPIPLRSLLLPMAVAALVGAAGAWLVKPTLSKDEHPPRVVDRAAPLAGANPAAPNAELAQHANTRASALVDPTPPTSILAGPAAAPDKPTIDAASQPRSRPRRAEAEPRTLAPTLGSFDQANPYGE
jgi:eukaryotic-like serine/threonine-protein kinase